MSNQNYHSNTRCCTCGSRVTYERPVGKYYWYRHLCHKEDCTRYICHECHKELSRNETKRIKEIHIEERKNIKCSICGCGSDSTGLSNGKPDWRKDKYREGRWNGKSYLCTACDSKIRSNLPGSQKNTIKSMRDSRIGNLDRFSEHGKDIITQWVVAKTLYIRDLNIENNNFRESVDLSEHPTLGKIDVKSGTFNAKYKWWRIGTDVCGDSNKKHNFDNLVILCMDDREPWERVKRVYIIPEGGIDVTSITIIENPSRSVWYEKYRVDEKPYNDTYISVDIPRFFGPFDLWNGRYDKIDKI